MGCSSPKLTIRGGGKPEIHIPDGWAVKRLVEDLDGEVEGAEFRVWSEPQSQNLSGWEIVLSFVHVSDVQVRDNDIVLDSEATEPVIDAIAKGARRTEALDRNDEYPYLALVEGINRLVSDKGKGTPLNAQEVPAFMIHTGDAIDAGSKGELLQFLNVSNRLKLPWFNVIGNHDVFLFGNFSQHRLRSDQLIPGLDLVRSRTQFMDSHGGNLAFYYPGGTPRHLYSHDATEKGNKVVPGSYFHGFDLTPSGTNSSPLSYYSFVTLQTSPPVMIVVLDTVAQDEDTEIRMLGGVQMPGFGAWSRQISEDQFLWLSRKIDGAAADGAVVLVFGHHPLSSLSQEEGELRYRDPNLTNSRRLRDFLKENRHVLAYFSGHTHFARIIETIDNSRGDRKFLEVIAPSMHEYPQLAFLVNILKKDHRIAVSVRPLQVASEGSATVVQRKQKACDGARQDATRQQRSVPSDQQCLYSRPPVADISRVAEVASGIKPPSAQGQTVSSLEK